MSYALKTPESLCRAGVARCDITPPVGIYHRMWGAATHDRSTGVHRPLTATALVLEPAPERRRLDDGPEHELVLLAVDLCLLWAKEMTMLRERISTATGVPVERLLVIFSHTHAAGLMGLERASLPGGELIEPYLKELAGKLAGIVQEARRAIQPATITYGRGRCSLAAHRDLWDEKSGQWVCGYHPEGPADDTVVVARIADFQNQTLGTIVNYACHPTTLAWDNTLISPDYPGAMREVVEGATSAPCFFIQGASGDLGPRDGYVGDTAVADRNGRQLGYAALAALEALPHPATEYRFAGPVVSGATIGVWKHEPIAGDALHDEGLWRYRRWTVDLAYRPGNPTAAEITAERERQQAAEAAARAAGDEALARDCRAKVEIATRQLVRLGSITGQGVYPFPIHLWQIGRAMWVAVESEHYQLLQRSLRERFPQIVIVVATVVNGSLHTYLPTRDVYGTGIYQETIALLAPGSLERLIDEIAAEIGRWLDAAAKLPALRYN